MRLSQIFRTTSFRLVAIYLGVFIVSVMALGVVVYVSVGREFQAEFDERVQDEMHALKDYAVTHGEPALTERIAALTTQAGALDYRLENADGARLAGNLPPIRASGGKYADGWIEIPKPEEAGEDDSDQDWARALVVTLGNGEVLVVGQEVTGVLEARRAVLVSFVWGLAATLGLGVAGGLVISAGFLRRLDGMSRAAEEIMSGNLRRRIPEINAMDDLGRLAQTFNRMLDRIEKLVEANRHAAQNIAHDLRRPLARVLRQLENARAGSSAEAYEAAVAAAIADINGLLETFSALLRIAQIETGARRASFARIDLAAVAREVAEAFQPAANDQGVQLDIETEAAIPLAGDEELLKQMIANVIDNALRHAAGAKQIALRSSQFGDAWALAISDEGPGVPETERQRIFERFYRLDAARTTPGDGLGLSLVAAIAELHGLTVAAFDNGPGLRIVFKGSLN